MNNYNVIMPLKGFVKFDARFQSVLNSLNSHQSTLHLVMGHEGATPEISSNSSVARHQKQQAQMHLYLKHETLDRMASSISELYPKITIVRHVVNSSLVKAVAEINDDVQASFLLVDKNSMGLLQDNNGDSVVEQLAAETELPLKQIDEHGVGSEVLAMLEIQSHNQPISALNGAHSRSVTYAYGR